MVVVILCCTSCDSPAERARKEEKAQREKESLAAAEKAVLDWFAKFSSPTSENEKAWGLTDLYVFGFTSVRVKPSDNPLARKATILCWCRGNSRQGASVRLQRTLSVDLKGGGLAWQVGSHAFVDERSLTFWHQSSTWALLSISYPVITVAAVGFCLFFGAALTGGLLQNLAERLFRLAMWGIALLSPLCASYIAYVVFDSSILAGAVGLLLFSAAMFSVAHDSYVAYPRLARAMEQWTGFEKDWLDIVLLIAALSLGCALVEWRSTWFPNPIAGF
jgi:hypothetical protein